MHSKREYLGFRQNSCSLWRTYLLVKEVSFLFISTGGKSVLTHRLINAGKVKYRVINKVCPSATSNVLMRKLATDKFLR
jgi:hypothetical protein